MFGRQADLRTLNTCSELTRKRPSGFGLHAGWTGNAPGPLLVGPLAPSTKSVPGVANLGQLRPASELLRCGAGRSWVTIRQSTGRRSGRTGEPADGATGRPAARARTGDTLRRRARSRGSHNRELGDDAIYFAEKLTHLCPKMISNVAPTIAGRTTIWPKLTIPRNAGKVTGQESEATWLTKN